MPKSNYYEPVPEWYQKRVQKRNTPSLPSYNPDVLRWGENMRTRWPSTPLSKPNVPATNTRLTSARPSSFSGPFPTGSAELQMRTGGTGRLLRPSEEETGFLPSRAGMDRPEDQGEPLAAIRGTPEAPLRSERDYAAGDEYRFESPKKEQTLAQKWANMDEGSRRRLGLSALVAGLGTLSRQRYSPVPQSPLADIGAGGLQGVQTYLDLEKEDRVLSQRDRELDRRTAADLALAETREEKNRILEENTRIKDDMNRLREKFWSEEGPLGRALVAGAELKSAKAGEAGIYPIKQAVGPGGEEGTKFVTKTGEETGFVPTTQQKTISKGTLQKYRSGDKEITERWDGEEWQKVAESKLSSSEIQKSKASKNEETSARNEVKERYKKAIEELKIEIALKKTPAGSALLAVLANINDKDKANEALNAARGTVPEDQINAFVTRLKTIHETYNTAMGEIDKRHKREDYWGAAQKAGALPSPGSKEQPKSSGLNPNIPDFNKNLGQ